MSNYTAIVIANSAKKKLKSWLASHGADDEERFETALTWNTTLVIISREIGASVSGQSYFRGTAFSPAARAIVFGLQGWLRAPKGMRSTPGDHNGEYCAINWSPQEVTIDRDVFGNARLLTTAGPRFAAVSDSIVVLASLRRALGESLSVNAEMMLARAVLNNTAAQQMSPDTMFSEISFVPAGFGVRIDKRFKVNLTGTPMADRLSARGEVTYRDQVRMIASDVCETVAGLASIDGWKSVLSLSGGYDSRVVFGAARSTDSFGPFSYFSANNSPVHTRDFEVATSLADAFGMPAHHDPAFKPDDCPQQKLTLWAASLLGVYDGFGPNRTSRGQSRSFTITGIGAELLKGNWGWRQFSALVADLNSGAVRQAYERQGRSGIEVLGGDPDSPYASELYYLGYRNGLHSAAGHIGLHMTGVHPLQQFQLAELGHARTNEGHRGNPSTIADISILIDADVAAFEYDDPSRDISTIYARDRLRALGGPLRAADIDALSVYGDPSSVPAGPSGVSMSIAQSIGSVGDYRKEVVLSLGEENLDLLGPELRPHYMPLIEHAAWRIGKVNGNVRTAGASSARVASLTALRLL